MTILILVCVVAALVVVNGLLVYTLFKRTEQIVALEHQLATLERHQERFERVTQQQLTAHREESGNWSRGLREEVQSSLKSMGDSTLKVIGEMGVGQRRELRGFGERLDHLTERSEKKLDAVRGAVDNQLGEMRKENSLKLDQMRETVDEKLQGTLDKRLGASFKLVSERLAKVHQGLGEMQTLANGVGDLKRVLSNVKTRGTWGEIQLGALLEQILAPEQYADNVAVSRRRSERVEYAIRLPGPDDVEGPLWLPIDAKFPMERYEALIEAAEQGDPEPAARELQKAIGKSARDIRDKYINPPATTDFAIMFLPAEGLYAEVIRRPGLAEQIQREHRVIIAGPTTLAALLNALQMGFRTLAIQKRSSEVWKVLANVRTQYGQFGELLMGVEKKLNEASNKIQEATKRSRLIEKRLSKVQTLPSPDDQTGSLWPSMAELKEPKPASKPKPKPASKPESKKA